MVLGVVAPTLDSHRRERYRRNAERSRNHITRRRYERSGLKRYVSDSVAIDALRWLGDDNGAGGYVFVTNDTEPELSGLAPTGWTITSFTITGPSYPGGQTFAASASGGGVFQATTPTLLGGVYTVVVTGTDDTASPVSAIGPLTIVTLVGRLLYNGRAMLYRNGNAMLLRKNN